MVGHGRGVRTGPAGTLPGQQEVSGFDGAGEQFSGWDAPAAVWFAAVHDYQKYINVWSAAGRETDVRQPDVGDRIIRSAAGRNERLRGRRQRLPGRKRESSR